MEEIKRTEKKRELFLIKQLDDLDIFASVYVEFEMRQIGTGVLERLIKSERIQMTREEKIDFLKNFEVYLNENNKMIKSREFVREYVKYIERELNKEAKDTIDHVKKVVTECFRENKNGVIEVGNSIIRVKDYSMIRLIKSNVSISLFNKEE